MEDQPEHQTPPAESSALIDSICQQLCQLSTTEAPDFAAMSRLARRSSLVAERLLLRANSPTQGLLRPITTLRHAVVFLGAAGVNEVAESLLLRVDEAHDAVPAPSRALRRTEPDGTPAGDVENNV